MKDGEYTVKQHEYLGRAVKNRFCIDGVDVLKYPWHSFGECVVVLDPNTKKPYALSSYSVTCGEKEIRFLAGRFDDGEWVFYDFDEID